MAEAKRHHTIPQFYLRGFARDETIGTVRLEDKRRFKQSVGTAASENHFYRVDGHPDGPTAFEKVLSGIEGDAATVFNKVVGGQWPLKPDDRMTLAYFLALQTVRGPEHRRNMELIAAQIARLEIGYGGRATVAAWVKRKHGVSITEDQAQHIWEQATAPGGPPVQVAASMHIEQIVKMSEALLPYIAGRPWILVRFERRSLVTSDAPVGLIPFPEDGPEDGLGFATAWGITFPLTRRLGLILGDAMLLAERQVPVERTWAGEFDSALLGTVQRQGFFNLNTIATASLCLYHHPDDGSLIPPDAELRGPNPASFMMAGGPDEFTGEPMFRSKPPAAAGDRS